VIDDDIISFIVRAKANSWNSDRAASNSSRPGSRDLRFDDGDSAYLDSYFGSINFVGQEVVWQQSTAVWAMNYHGTVLRPDLYDGSRAGATSQVGRGRVYDLNTFLGEHRFVLEHATFCMSTSGDASSFSGSEWHEVDGLVVYRFRFHGGSITYDSA
jgi:hypothetical protein